MNNTTRIILFTLLVYSACLEKVCANSNNENNPIIDSLEQILPSALDIDKIKILCDLCWEYRFVSSEKAMAYGEQALELAKSLNDSIGIAQAYNDVGILYSDLSQYEKAIDYYTASLEIRIALNDIKGQLAIYNKIGIVFQKQGKLQKSLENQLKALVMAEQLNHKPYMAYCLNNIAIIHFNIKNYDKSLEYHAKALAIRKESENYNGIAASYGNMANVYTEVGNIEEAIKYLTLALKIFETLNDQMSTGVQLANIGGLKLGQGKTDEALAHLQKALIIRENLGEQKYIASTLIKIGQVYLAKQQPDRALIYIHEGLDIAKRINVNTEVEHAYLDLAKAYMLNGLTDSSTYYLNAHINMKDSLYKVRIDQQLVEAQTKFETKQKDQSIAMLEQETQLNTVEIQHRKTQLWLLLSLMVSFLGAAFTYNYRRVQKQKMQQAKDRQQASEAMLNAVIESQEREREKVARELHDGVGQTLAAVKMSYELLSESVENTKRKQAHKENLSHLDNICKEVRTISHQMLPKTLVEVGLDKAIQLLIDQQFITDDLICKPSFDIATAERLPMEVELAYYRIVQELCNNINKHAKASVVSIKLSISENYCYMLVKDNGIGYNVNEKNQGIGLANIYSRAKQINAKIEIESDKGRGTKFSLKWNK